MLFCSSGSDENALRAQHTDTVPSEALNSSKLTAFAEAHRCGCVPPKAHLWFNKLPVADACYSVTRGVDCDQASQTYLPWATAETESIKYFGLSGTGYVQVRLRQVTNRRLAPCLLIFFLVQNRDMEGECSAQHHLSSPAESESNADCRVWLQTDC